MIFEDKSANDFLMLEGNADDYKSAIKYKIQEFTDAINGAKKDDAKKRYRKVLASKSRLN
ncbi:hypothetical protein CWC46_15095 [Prodigiosinella confusarubida]|uniref:Uncharacterized protein n=1 Tax=Serratia sp. (strain ATCC 39006) TaxID=104623 RepID=A0A2I5T8Z8_SERS3|nr:hypothetical protein [Serratia sp. ATCC 39006]AUH01024.1 hypothetical protein CWC46_15095 [Serratia sp. ATCC 39006]AUH05345.1 hypothetical protein Ser39006_015100 [Serratia sp. ATCC 39006]